MTKAQFVRDQAYYVLEMMDRGYSIYKVSKKLSEICPMGEVHARTVMAFLDKSGYGEHYRYKELCKVMMRKPWNKELRV